MDNRQIEYNGLGRTITTDDCLIIDMFVPYAQCWNCGDDTVCKWGLPVHNGDLVSNEFPGEWGGVASCKSCFELHKQGKLPVFDEYYI